MRAQDYRSGSSGAGGGSSVLVGEVSIAGGAGRSPVSFVGAASFFISGVMTSSKAGMTMPPTDHDIIKDPGTMNHEFGLAQRVIFPGIREDGGQTGRLFRA